MYVCAGGDLLFAGTEAGSVLCYKLPLSAEAQPVEWWCHSSAVTGLRLSHNDTMLLTCSADGSICIFDVRLDPSRMAAGKE